MKNKLKQAREKRGWTQEKLSEKAGVSRATISYIENGNAECIKTNTLVKIADAFGVKVTTLFF